MDISTAALIRIFLILLYATVGVLTYWRLFPRLSPISKRLASAMLLAQIFVIVVALEIRLSSEFERWLWNLDQEWNIPSTLASTQLALVAGVALVTAWLARARTAWQRLYLVAMSLVFLFLARDEYFKVHEHIQNWQIYYAALGTAVVASTALVASRSPRRTWIWHICFVIGLAMSGIGAMLFEAQRWVCSSWGIFRFDGCMWSYNYEESLEFLGIWLVLVAMLGLFSEAAPSPKRLFRRALYALPALWVLFLIHDAFVPSLELWLLAQPASVQIESGVQLHGYRVDSGEGASVVRLYASAERRDYLGLGYSVHLVDQVTGDSIAGRDEYANRQSSMLFAPGHAHVYRQWVDVEIPSNAPTNRALWIVLTLWRKRDRDFVRQKVLNSDHQLLNDTQVVLGELVLRADSAGASTASLAEFDNGIVLDAVEMPERAQAGETLRIPFTWHSDESGQEDLVQFLHFGFENSGDWWVYDRPPLGPRLPTRLWYSGLADTELWEVPLPPDLAPGRYEVFTGLYRSRDLERISARDADGLSWLDGRVSLGAVIID